MTAAVPVRMRLRPRFARALCGLAWALVGAEGWGWGDVVLCLRAQLGPGERLALAAAALGACEVDDDYLELIDAAVAEVDGGCPMPPLRESIAEEAADWAAWASEPERKHYLLACFRSLPTAERVKFLAAAQRSALA